MKHLLLLALMLLSALLTSCASWDASNQGQMLSAAGFTIQRPETAKQQEIYNAMEPYKLVNGTVNGKLLFAYKDLKKGIVYVGAEPQYQRYQQIAVQRRIAQDQILAAQMNQSLAYNWGYWGPRGIWW
jgi:hypothetical protein